MRDIVPCQRRRFILPRHGLHPPNGGERSTMLGALSAAAYVERYVRELGNLWSVESTDQGFRIRRADRAVCTTVWNLKSSGSKQRSAAIYICARCAGVAAEAADLYVGPIPAQGAAARAAAAAKAFIAAAGDPRLIIA